MKDADEHDRWNNIKPMLGVFHFFMEVFKKSNAVNEDVARMLVSSYIGKGGNAATENNVQYFLNFADPTIYERQLGQIILACYDHAKRCMQKSTGRTHCSAKEL